MEDTENSRNGTIHAGGPFQVAHILDEDVLDLIGLVKLLLRMINRENTRDVAVLAYYAERPIFAFEARYERGKEWRSTLMAGSLSPRRRAFSSCGWIVICPRPTANPCRER